MAHEIIPIERIQREALKAELLYINANDANPYPRQSRAAQVFKEQYMTRSVLIGLTGYAGTGKDTVRALLEEYGMSGFAFADPIRNMVRELLTSNGIDDCWMDRRELKEEIIPQLGVSYRELAQTLGTEWGRSLKGDFWLRIASAYVTDLKHQGAVALVVSDVRFINEAEWVRKQGGVIWRIHRELAGPVREHVSESELDDIKPNITIHNDGSLVDLSWTVAEAVRELT